LIDHTYVKKPDDVAAATASKALFAAMKKAGWCDVRLLGLTDVIRDQDDVPRESFEETAAKKIGCWRYVVRRGYREIGRQTLPARSHSHTRRFRKLRHVPREFQGEQGQHRGIILHGAHDSVTENATGRTCFRWGELPLGRPPPLRASGDQPCL